MRFIFLLLLLDLFDHLVLRFAVRFSFSLSFDYSLCKKWLSFIFSTLCFVLFFCVLSPLVSSALHPVSVVSPLKIDPHAVSCPEWSSLRIRLGFHRMHNFNSANQNKLSATQHPKVINEYLAHEIARCRVAFPFYSPPFPNLHISSFGVSRGNGV